MSLFCSIFSYDSGVFKSGSVQFNQSLCSLSLVSVSLSVSLCNSLLYPELH